MTDRLPSDHASVDTVRAEVVRSGGTRRPCLRLPDDVALDGGEYVRLVFDGDEYHARVQQDATGLLCRGAYDLKAEARDPAGAENRLVEWLQSVGRGPDTVVEFDEVLAGDLYGVRVPGRRAVYHVQSSPSGSLQDIANDLDG
jgi:hypothetical protein